MAGYYGGYGQQPYGQVAPYGQTGNYVPANVNPLTHTAYAPMNGQSQQYAPMQQQQPQMQPQRLNGRVIQSLDDVITPDTVPMDGTVSYFPVANGNSIVAKYWGDHGIETRLYALVQDEQPADTEKDTFREDVLARLDGIEQALKDKQAPSTATARRSSTKKEG